MAISQYAGTVSNLMRTNHGGDVLLQQSTGGVKADLPVNPPGKWTHFKAALSGLPLLGSLGSLQRARAEVADYPVRLAEQQASSRRFLNGFAQDLRAAFGSDIADMCLRDVDQTGGTPITARKVDEVLKQAERAQQVRRSHNNMAVMRFLESPLQGAAHAPGETDMNGVFLDRDMQLNGATSWQEAMGAPAAKFVTAYVQKQCEALPEHSQGRVSNEQMVQAARNAFDLYQELKSLPGMTEARLADTVGRASQKGTAVEIRNAAREFAVVADMKTKLDRHDPGSMLSRTAADVAHRYGLATIPDAVLKCIEGNVTEGLSYRVGAMPAEFGCADDAASIMTALAPRLEMKTRLALEEHCAALQMIEQSTTLLPDQKEILRGIAASRRIDRTQVAQFERLAQGMAAGATSIETDLQGQNFESALDTLGGLVQAFGNGIVAMKEAGEAVWESGSLASGEMADELMWQSLQLAAASMTPAQAQTLFQRLTGPNGHQLMQGLMQTLDIQLAVQAPLLNGLVQALGQRAGMTPEQAASAASQLQSNRIAPNGLHRQLAPFVLPERKDVSAGFLATMKLEQERPLSQTERTKLTTLPGGHIIGRSFVDDVARTFDPKMPDGSSMVDRTNWDTISPDERLQRIEAGFVRLIDLCGGDEERARTFTLVAHQGMAGGFPFACGTNPDESPTRLPDGRPIVFDQAGQGVSERDFNISFVHDDEGNLTLHFEYRLRHADHAMLPQQGEPIWLDPQASYVSYSYDAAMADDGHLEILGRPTCKYNVQAFTDWPVHDYPPPGGLELRDLAGAACHDDLHAFARRELNEENLLVLEAMTAFRQNPTMANAIALKQQFLDPDSPQQVNVSHGQRAPFVRAFDQAVTQAAGNPNALVDPMLFDGLQTEITHLVETDMLPRFKAAMIAQHAN